MNPKNIYIIGKAVGSSRTQNLIKYLLDQNYNVHYNSVTLNFFEGKNGINRIIRWTTKFFIRFIEKILRIYFLLISDVVILPAMCNLYQFELPIAKFFKKIIITDFYISLYDTSVLDYKNISSKSKKAEIYLKYDYNLIKKANFTLFLNKTEANRYLNIVNINFDITKHFIVPLVIEEEIKCNLPYYNNENSVFNICWWGNYIPLHGLDKIINACKILKDNYNLNFHLYLFGTDDQKAQKYVNLITKLELNHLITIDNHSTFKNGKLGLFLKNNCDLVLGNFGDSDKAKNVLVNKLIDGVAMKCPVLTGESIAPLEYFSENEVFYSNNDENLIAEKILSISQINNVEILKRVESAYRIYVDNFSVKAYTKKMNELFSKL